MSGSGTYTDGLDLNFRPDVLFANISVMLVLTTICVGLRIYVRTRMIRSFSLDDWVLVAAYLSLVGFIAFDYAYGIGALVRGFEDDDEFILSEIETEFWGLPYIVCLILVRAAIATFFLRTIPVTGYTWQRIVIKATLIIYTLYATIYFFVNLFACGDPLDVTNPDPVCLSESDMNNMALAQTILSMVTDWLFTLLPITIIYRSMMSRNDKMSIMGIMFLGCIDSSLSVVRIPLLSLGIVQGAEQLPHLTIYFVLAAWECAFGIVAISLAALRPLVAKHLPGSSVQASNDPDGSGNGMQMLVFPEDRDKDGKSSYIVGVV